MKETSNRQVVDAGSAEQQYFLVMPVQSQQSTDLSSNLVPYHLVPSDLVVSDEKLGYPVSHPSVPYYPTTIEASPVFVHQESAVNLWTAPLRIWVRPASVLASLAWGSAWAAVLPILLTLLTVYARDLCMVFLGSMPTEGVFVRGVLGILLGWPLCAGMIFFMSRTMPSYVRFAPILTVSAWAMLPLALRNLAELFYMISNGEVLVHRGLSGLLMLGNGIGDPALTGLTVTWTQTVAYALLSYIDIYTFLHLFLLVLAVRVCTGFAAGRAVCIAGLYGLLIAGIGLGILMVQQLV